MGNPLSPSEIEMAEEIAEAHRFDELSSARVAASDEIRIYTSLVNRLLEVTREVNRTPVSMPNRIRSLEWEEGNLLDSILASQDFLNTLLTNAGHQVRPAEYEHDIMAYFSNEHGRLVKLTEFNR
jgi:hypothetical protein